jgi:phosphatidylinositol 4-kinase
MWTTFVRQTWQLDPGIAVHLTERFTVPALASEVTSLVRSNPLACLDVPEALNFLVGDKLDSTVRRDLRVILILPLRRWV